MKKKKARDSETEDLVGQDVLQGIRRAHDEDFPLVNVAIINQTSREAINGMPGELYIKRYGGGGGGEKGNISQR